jgi:hypothetical protein
MEITTFRLVAGVSASDFVVANADIDAYLRRQPGFRWRRVLEEEDGTIIDLVSWASLRQGEASSRKLMREMAASPVHATIDQGTVVFRLAPVFHEVTGAGSPLPSRRARAR